MFFIIVTGVIQPLYILDKVVTCSRASIWYTPSSWTLHQTPVRLSSSMRLITLLLARPDSEELRLRNLFPSKRETPFLVPIQRYPTLSCTMALMVLCAS